MTEGRSGNGQDLFTIVSVFHYVLGGFQMLMSLLGMVYVLMGHLILSGQFEADKGSPPPEALGWAFSGFGVILTVVLLTMGILVLRAGRNMARKRNRMFCIVIDAILCLMVPFGTIVGIFGLVLLMKPESEDIFTG